MAEIVALKPEAQAGPVLRSLSDGVLRLVLASPPANALSVAMIAALLAELEAAAADTNVRVVVIGAEGKVFSGGHDLKELTAHRVDPDGGRGFFEKTFVDASRLMTAIAELPQPVIAAVDGIAAAAGCQLVAACDLAIASSRATFGVNGINVGLFCSTPSVALTRKVNMGHAMEMLLTGEMIEATTAREFGLVNRVVPEEYLGQVVAKYAHTIAAKSPLAVRLGKAALRHQAGKPLAEAYALSAGTMVENLLAHDAQEGISAFLAKRKPEWKGR